MLPKTLQVICFLLSVSVGHVWADKGFFGNWGDQGNGTYKNPILPGDYSDPDVIRMGDNYIMISSTFRFSPGLVVLKSADLVNWTIIGYVVSDLTQIASKFGWSQMDGTDGGIWAPTIRYHNGVYWVYFGTPAEGFFMSTATDPAGPWAPLSRVTVDNNPNYPGAGWDDPGILWDDDGKGYLVGSNFSSGSEQHLWQMSGDGKKLISATDRIIQRGGEGAKIFKRNGYYYIQYSQGSGSARYVWMLRANSIWGSGGSSSTAGIYETKQVQENILGDRAPSQGGLVQTVTGSWYFLTQASDVDIEGRPCILSPASWVNDWPIYGVDTDNDGKGEIVWEADKPLTGHPITIPQSDDEFSTATLGLQWQWNYQPRADKWSLSSKTGYLRLHAFRPLSPDNLLRAGNTISQRFMRGDWGTAVTKIDIDNMADGQEAGMCHFSSRQYCTIGIAQNSGTRKLRYKNSSTGSVIFGSTIPASTTTVWLKSEMNNSQNTAFLYSLDGTNFTQLGSVYDLTFGDYRGDMLGVYCFNNSMDSGYIDVDWFHYNYAGPLSATAPSPNGEIRIEAEKFSSMNGIQTEPCSEGGQNVAYIENGDWCVYNNVMLSGQTVFKARVAGTGGGNIEIRLGNATGELIGTCAVAPTGNWQSWTTATVALKPQTETKNLCLRFTGGSGFLFNVNWISFSSDQTQVRNSVRRLTPKTFQIQLVRLDGKIARVLTGTQAMTPNLARTGLGSGVYLVKSSALDTRMRGTTFLNKKIFLE